MLKLLSNPAHSLEYSAVFWPKIKILNIEILIKIENLVKDENFGQKSEQF